ncbi:MULTISPECIES: NAD(P)H-dependent glycerol-3-phosphate dehydrogenase [Planktothricoides]|uniref:Glycerol-3-phosphate dehydrogenase [NAD(P)+] n=2 Tax=Planktothricoides raciborskii TaxID=132608 RepID=A0AAU8JDS1_9CYAN|nr:MULTISPECIES: NAD(P)H-dependent glycerol-3-phosphate dehydrogenase [Planktothricoides]KOR37910.1 glycerol-3-phosphate dehydrogenase [Planktothricoides sp. SR001]MBD2542747.1 NAD(P)H-dependent glycerol-3-phosphate dehydrogenase [Planktothricoides raciborskii FACHB-1370]MBD2581506.1 NAD(P)H-dependent glycerol-3-phosphate dehydrogenase [Planktothricoides raciborskii FACHB-1261]
MKPKTLAILGAGAWGTTLGQLVRENGHEVRLWSRRSPDSLGQVVAGSDMILSAVSMKGVTAIVEQIHDCRLSANTILITATKGLDPLTTCTPSQLWEQALGDRPVVVLAGPNLSKEIQQGLPAATVVASHNVTAAQQVQGVFSSPSFRVYTNSDPLGVELGGTLKNVMAIAAGVCDGLELGTNAKAALLTRGLAEMIRVGTHWGAQTETFYGLSGLGDLLATCNSPLSRNYQVGYQLGLGRSLSEILASLEGTAEGVNTTQVLIQRAQAQNISVPISYQVYKLLQGEITPKAAVEALMLRDTKPE